MDDFPILKLFKGENITLSNQAKLEINDENLRKKLVWTNNKINSEEVEYKIGLNKSKENPMTYIEKKIYMNISYLSSNIQEEKDKYYEKVKSAASCFTKSVYSEKLRKKDISPENKTEKEIKDNIFNFFDFKEEKALNIQYNVPLIFKTEKGYEEINISDEELKNKDLK